MATVKLLKQFNLALDLKQIFYFHLQIGQGFVLSLISLTCKLTQLLILYIN